MNPVRMRFIREKLLEVAQHETPDFDSPSGGAELLRGLDILDVGCGGGLLSEVGFSRDVDCTACTSSLVCLICTLYFPVNTEFSAFGCEYDGD